MEKGRLPVGLAQNHSENPKGATEWITEYFHLFPKEARPDPAHINEFANFFWTYIVTSFDVISKPARLVEPGGCGCLCPFCAKIKNAPNLQPRKLRKSDKLRANELMGDRVTQLAREEKIPTDSVKIQTLVSNPVTRRAAGFSTYGFWLIQRVMGMTDGASILALWREIART